MGSPIAIIEKRGTIHILKRSYEFATNNFIFIFFTVIVLYVIHFAVDYFILTSDLGGSMIGLMLSKATILVFVPLQSIMQTLVYFNIRIEKEGLNAEILRKEMDDGVDGTAVNLDPGCVSVSVGDIECNVMVEEKFDGAYGSKTLA